MFDHVDPRSPTPLYAQIATRLRVAIAAGELRPGEALPSVRQLAGRLRINPATVVQAYRELEMEGLVNTRQGAGTFVQDVAPERGGEDDGDPSRPRPAQGGVGPHHDARRGDAGVVRQRAGARRLRARAAAPLPDAHHLRNDSSPSRLFPDVGSGLGRRAAHAVR